jgi:hypothetical protein
MMLPRRGAIPGRGWGCFQCGLPAEGACAVLCDPCLEAVATGQAVIVDACRGYPATDGRIPLAELQGAHEHNAARHPELTV